MDLVLFLSCFSSFEDQAWLRGSIINIIKEKLDHCSRSLAYNITVAHHRLRSRAPRSLTFQVQARKSSEVVKVDVLPAFHALGKDSDGLGPENLVRGPSLSWPRGKSGKVEISGVRVEFALFQGIGTGPIL